MPAPLRDVPDEALELIKSFEGIPDGDPDTVNIDAYIDPVGIWTIGWGHAIAHQGGWLRGAENKAVARSLYPGGITKVQAETLLRGDLLDSARDVLRLVKVGLDDGQFGALVSFAFNLGAGNLGQSTLCRMLNSGDYGGAADQFLRWNMGTINGVKKPLAGLTRRRGAERALFLGEDWRAAAGVRGRKVLAAKKNAGPAKPKPARKPVTKSVTKPATQLKPARKTVAAVKPRGRTTTPTGLPPTPKAKPRRPQKAR
jgi:GH24 family phage-related lysozyme (muramidase)